MTEFEKNLPPNKLPSLDDGEPFFNPFDPNSIVHEGALGAEVQTDKSRRLATNPQYDFPKELFSAELNWIFDGPEHGIRILLRKDVNEPLGNNPRLQYVQMQADQIDEFRDAIGKLAVIEEFIEKGHIAGRWAELPQAVWIPVHEVLEQAKNLKSDLGQLFGNLEMLSRIYTFSPLEPAKDSEAEQQTDRAKLERKPESAFDNLRNASRFIMERMGEYRAVVRGVEDLFTQDRLITSQQLSIEQQQNELNQEVIARSVERSALVTEIKKSMDSFERSHRQLRRVLTPELV